MPRWLSWAMLGFMSIYVGYYFMVVRKLASVYVKAHTRASQITQKMAILASPYAPTFWAFNRHLTTLLGSEMRYKPKMKFRREELKTPDGGFFGLDWLVTDLPQDAPTLFIAPGLTGSSESAYVRHVMATARDIGFQPVVMIYRGLVGLKLATPMGYSAGFTNDMDLAVEHIHQLRPRSPLYAAGYSLGSNILVKYLGEQGPNTCIRAAVSVGNPFDLLLASESLSSNPLYSIILCSLLRKYYMTHRDMFKTLDHFIQHDEELASVKHLRDFDRLVTAHIFKFQSVDHYYSESSSSKFIENVQIPLLFISAEDDPVVHTQSLPLKVPEKNPNVIVVVTKRGGHLGFLEGWWPTGANWCDRVVGRFLSVCAEMNLSNPRGDEHLS